MEDATETIQNLRTRIQKFVVERDWQKFHRSKNLVMAIAVEAAELMEIFQWSSSSGPPRRF